MSIIREPAVAGLFYSAEENELKTDIKNMLANAKDNFSLSEKEIFGIIVPHAGYIYSGETAAEAYSLIKNKNYNRVVVLSPSHREYFEGNSIYNGDFYKTPLGIIEIDKEFSERLVENSDSIFRGEKGHQTEHALEVHLPFLQTVLNDFKLVPIVMGAQTNFMITDLAEALAQTVDENTLIVASTDLSHFYSKKEANYLDGIVEEKINNFDFNGLQKGLELENCFACGGGLVVASLMAAQLKGYSNCKVVKRSDSGDVTGDNQKVVGYLSAVIYK